jgi:hypothetical protein
VKGGGSGRGGNRIRRDCAAGGLQRGRSDLVPLRVKAFKPFQVFVKSGYRVRLKSDAMFPAVAIGVKPQIISVKGNISAVA